MEKGKFSQPRIHREEERRIEEAFRQVTGQEPAPQSTPAPVFQPREDVFSPETQLTEPAFPADSDLFDEEYPLEEDSPEEPGDLLESVMDFCSRNKKVVLVGLCAVALALIVGILSVFFLSGSDDPYDNRILNNVFIADINVGGMTKAEASSALKQAIGKSYEQQDMVILLAGTELSLSPKDTGAKLNIDAVVETAFAYGRSGTAEEREAAYESSLTSAHTIGLLPYLNLDTGHIRSILQAYAEDSGSTLTQTSYGLEGRQPELRADKFDPDQEGQTLVITMGTPGISFDVDTVYDMVLDAYSLHRFVVTVEDVETVAEPDPLDLEAVYEEFYIAPIDATIDLKTFEVIPGSYGCHFDLAAAMRLVNQAEYGEVIRIPMEYIEPEAMDEDTLFGDVLGYSETPHGNNENRTTNLRLACQALDGHILNPGDSFSFNDVVGKRTAEKGYKPAPAYSGHELVDTLGGGICQVSSTLYHSALLADLEIVSRTNHGYPVSYTDYGLDATVSWGGPDLKFRNNSNYPVKIEAEVSGGYVRIKITGTEERDYYVEMESVITNTYKPEVTYQDFPYDNPEGYKDGDVIDKGATGYYVKTYKVKYDRVTHQRISRDFETNSVYMTRDKVIARVEPEETEPPTTVPETEPETTAPPETTEPPVTNPLETQPPETTSPPETQASETEPPETTSPQPSTEATQPDTNS